MIALAELVLAVAWTFGANGFLLAQPLAGVDAVPGSWLRPLAARARVVFHARPDWAMAFYVPPAGERGLPSDALPPGIAVGPGPRIFLFAPYYLAHDGLVSSERMSVDVAEYYLHALLDGRLDLESRQPGAAYPAQAAERADLLMQDVPPDLRWSAYLAAASDFGAHVLSIANEIERMARRHEAAGRDLCRSIDQPASLFGLWSWSFASGSYLGHYLISEDGGGALSWRQSRESLARHDKDLLLRSILRVAWSGEPREDFRQLCPAAGSVGDGDAADAG